MRPALLHWPLGVGVFVFFMTSSRVARAEETAVCIDANADAQKLERAGKLSDAKKKLVLCANASCPAAIRSDCAQILTRVEAEECSIAIEVRDEVGQSTTHARVMIDDVPVADAAMGRAVVVDPGPHVIVADLDSLKREVRIVSVEGEKNKHVAIDFTTTTPATSTSSRFTIPWVSWAFGGVSVLSAGAFTYFGLTGNGIKNRLDTSCRATTSCASSEYFDMSTSYTAANVFAAIAIGSVVVAVVTALVWPRAKRTSTMSMIVHGRF